jgi:hypothetical protein
MSDKTVSKVNKSVKDHHPIPTEEDLNEVKTFWMIHQGHTSNPREKSQYVYEDYDKAKQDIIKLILSNPNKRYYLLKSTETFIGKAKDVVIEGKNIA